ncbi:CapA family protein [Vibrio coralliilyticus]|uniref:CapA family protein n=1 Tax=Vibrio coralliilyticus TaxID=190893 RepID=UPI001E39B5CA|nr:CapA family protein [Vibrio coralliilyticus]MCC2524560.1 CapA family protein [Vibrio coralliilyticus]
MKIALLGDIGQFGDFTLKNTAELRESLTDIAKLLSSCDVVVGNLETPFSQNSRPYGSKSAYISSDPENVNILKYLNVTHVNLANNHIFDYGMESYCLTKSLLEDAGIEYFGIEGLQCYIERSDAKVALSGFCSYNTNPMKMNFFNDVGVNALDVDSVFNIFRGNNDKGFLNIVSFHSGIEHVNYPSYSDVIFARKLSEIAPYVYYGHHPHVIQPVERVNSSLINYSLGNFCFSDVYIEGSDKPLIKMSDNNRSGLIIVFDVDDNEIKNVNKIPIYINKGSIEINSDCALSILNNCQKVFNENILNPKKYKLMRSKLIASYLSDRKQLRNLTWFVKRLKIRYVILLLNSKINHYLYKKHFIKKLN